MASTWSPIAQVYDPLQAGSIDGTDTEAHDAAIIRAMNAKYKPNVGVKGDPHCTVFVSRLNPSTVEETLQEAFDPYGSIKRLRIVRDLVTGFSKGYAFIEYKSEYDAHSVARKANKLSIDGNEVFVDMECERILPKWVPRRFGGGFGGKKESGQLRFGGKDRPFHKPLVAMNTHRDQGKHQDDFDRRDNRDAYHRDRRRSRSRSRGRQKRSPDRRGRSKDRERRRRSRDRSRSKGREQRSTSTSRGREGRRNRSRSRGRERRSRSRERRRQRSRSADRNKP